MIRAKIKLLMGVFFDWKDIVHNEICSTWSDGKQTVAPGNVSAFDEFCAQEKAWIVGNPHFDVAPRQCAYSRVARHPQLSGKTSDIRCALTTLLSGPTPSTLLPVFKSWKDFEMKSFQYYRWYSGKCGKGTARLHRKWVPGSISKVEEKLRNLYRQ